MKTVIDAHNISRIYNPETIPVYAVNNVHLHFERGEFTAIVGPSGSGKTTLLNLIGGLDRSDSGNIIINKAFTPQVDQFPPLQYRLCFSGI
jgi:putative ABC transport system ATP-binding protein